MKVTEKSRKSATGKGKKSEGFTPEERAAAKARVREMKRGDAGGENDVLAAIAAMSGEDRTLGKRLHAIITAAAPALSPKTWYGMPAYARDGKVVCHFQPAQKFKTRYATLGFSDQAKLDDGSVWPVAYAVKELSAADEQRITSLVKKAVG